MNHSVSSQPEAVPQIPSPGDQAVPAAGRIRPPSTPSRMPAAEDMQLVKDYLLLPVLLEVLERDMSILQTLKLKMPAPYVRTLRGVQDQVTSDLASVRTRLRQRGVKVYEERRTAAGIEAMYLCRGYHYPFSMLWSLIKAEVEQRLNRYLGLGSDT
ncbi:hypothetical protein [Paenibacillus sp. y28]|uniref:hypothetical protein n=1 Tax=Paenibacillus sp. y28 TaxID=3129110 RepID=UPI00301867CC